MAKGSRAPPADEGSDKPRASFESTSSVSTTSLVFERLGEEAEKMEKLSRKPPSRRPATARRYQDLDELEDEDPLKEDDGPSDLEEGPFLPGGRDVRAPPRHMNKTLRRVLIGLAFLFALLWAGATVMYTRTKAANAAAEHDPNATKTKTSGKKITLDQVMQGFWWPRQHDIRWIASPDGEDGLLLEKGASGKEYLVVEDVRALNEAHAGAVSKRRVLMESSWFTYEGKSMTPDAAVPSPDFEHVLLSTSTQSNWRHSSTAVYWIYNVASKKVQPLVAKEPDARVQLVTWSPQGSALTYTRDNNLYLRAIEGMLNKPITTDGGPELFYGVPDWVYEEEVFGDPVATWWSEGGDYVAFLRTNETGVPDYPIQYFASRPSGKKPAEGEESYPEVRQIKYPKAGAHNPVVDLQFYDVSRAEVFSVPVSGTFDPEDRLITTVKWAGDKVIVKETNRVSDVMRVVVIDPAKREGKAVRTIDVGKIDGGWFEISQKTQYIPADPANGREHDGYIDTIIHANGDHLAYYSPIDNPEPLMLTSGPWEVVDAPSAVDLKNNLVYFVATKESPIQRHVYSVALNGTGLKPFTDVKSEGYYGISFSSGAGYALLSYSGPKIPWQKVVSTLGSSEPGTYEHVIEDNSELAEQARKHELPLLKYGTLRVGEGSHGSAPGVDIHYVERRPPHFDPDKRYPVLFQQYSGPGSQSVTKRFAVDFQSYVAAALGYIVVTVDGRGTGFIGRRARVLVRGHLGVVEAGDQITAAREWAGRPYVDADRIAIWGWSYGGFMTLKTLEMDGGRTFRYGMAVAPVTDWRFYDSIYTERYMRTPQENEAGYDESRVGRNVTALGQNVRFLVMHGVADDNVHLQNTLALLDRLDQEGVENYDVHVFPDSDHGIRFHNANRIVYDKLSNWLINAFNGEWLRVAGAKPLDSTIQGRKEGVEKLRALVRRAESVSPAA